MNTAPRAPPEAWRLQVLKHLQASLSQRQLAAQLGVSLGKANYCLRALVEKGLVKLGNFRKNQNKRQYAYLLTPAGVEKKPASPKPSSSARKPNSRPSGARSKHGKASWRPPTRPGKIMGAPFPPVAHFCKRPSFVIQSWDILLLYPNRISRSEP